MKKILIILGVIMSVNISAGLLPKYYEKVFKNDFKVVAIPLNNGSDVISIQLVYKVGSRDEVMGKSGIAHMLEHLNFKSTKNLKAGEFDEIVKSFGGVSNASTSFDNTKYYINTSSRNLDKSLSLFSELMENQLLLDKEFQTERDVVYEERRWRTDNSPTGYLYFKLFNNLFTYSSYHWTPIGFKKDIENWNIKDIRKFHKKFYQPSNAILVVAGDIDSKDVFKLAKKYFAKIKNKKKIQRVHTKEQDFNEKKEIVLRKDTKIEYLALAFHTADFSHSDHFALSVLADILSDGRTSRLYKSLVNEKKLFTSISAYDYSLKDNGVFLFFGSCASGVDANEAKKALIEEIEKIKKTKISKMELQKIKNNTKFDFLSIIESSSRIASLFANHLSNDNLSPLIDYENEINKMTTKDVQEVAKKWLNIDKSVSVILKDDNK